NSTNSAENHPRIKNYHVSTKEIGQKIIFLRKLTEGGSEHSFGVHVARMAGMPPSIVQRANEILGQLEQKHIETEVSDSEKKTTKNVENKAKTKEKVKNATEKPMQLNFFDIGDPRLQRIKDALDNMDLNAMTPIELMLKVSEWKRMLEM
ncbi:MAG: DNA mismatch repair protein MutS, partial [Saprospiraceae bacterium]|nr:DNA mismatch repair protein MutS [Saprospiraceae bacterium]